MKQGAPAPASSMIEVAGHRIEPKLVSHIQQASRKTGISFSYLMAQAAKESGFEAAAKSRVSSASGLFQFTKSTWLAMVKKHGAEYGLGDLAQKIQRGSKGEMIVADPQARQKILDLRRDPEVSALMAAEYAKDNQTYLEKKLDRPIQSADLYLAHFLGPGGAAKFLKEQEENAAQSAAEVAPRAARANPTVFYNGNSPRSIAAVYEKIRDSIEDPMSRFAHLDTPPKTEERPVALAEAASPAPPPVAEKPPQPVDLLAEALIAAGEGGNEAPDAMLVSAPMPRAGEGPQVPAAPAQGLLEALRRGLFG